MARILYVSCGLRLEDTVKENIETKPDREKSRTGDQAIFVDKLDQALKSFDEQGPFDFVVIEFKLPTGRLMKETPGAQFLQKLKFKVPRVSIPVAVLTQEDVQTTFHNLKQRYPHIDANQIFPHYMALPTVINRMKSLYCPSARDNASDALSDTKGSRIQPKI